MKVIIQCAASKASNAGFLQMRTGRPVKFVARPDQAPRSEEWLYACPDDPSDVPEQSWRQQLVTYNMIGDNNPFGLLEAYRLYQNPVYEELATALGAANVFILSAGWGLIRASYLLPFYDITFTALAECYKRRRPHDKYDDFCHLHSGETGPIVFLGGRDYLPLFEKLTDPLPFDKIVFHTSAHPPQHPGWRTLRFETRKRTNWHYDCARALLERRISI